MTCKHHTQICCLLCAAAVLAANPGKKINFVEHDVNSSLADQVAPYKLFGCTASSYFAGTLFRFPLRTQEQADASTISKQVRSQWQRGLCGVPVCDGCEFVCRCVHVYAPLHGSCALLRMCVHVLPPQAPPGVPRVQVCAVCVTVAVRYALCASVCPCMPVCVCCWVPCAVHDTIASVAELCSVCCDK